MATQQDSQMQAISTFWSFPFLSLCLVSQHLQSALLLLKSTCAQSPFETELVST